MKNREIYLKDPTTFNLINNGVSKVGELGNDEEKKKTLRFELETFVCEGAYEDGLKRTLNAFLTNLDKPEQEAVWVSGFFGSGKSHFVKMLRYLWENYTFEDGATARSLVKLPDDIKDDLVELSTQARKYGGLRAVSGTLSEGSSENVRLAFLQILFRANGLPEKYPAAKFVLWLKQEKKYDRFRQFLVEKGKDPEHEIKNLYVSPSLAEALVSIIPNYSSSSDARASIKAQFPPNDSPTIKDVMDTIRQIFTNDSKLPLILIVMDEVQQYVGDIQQRSMDIQEIAEKCCKDLNSHVLLVGTGQSALTATPSLQKLQARFTVPVKLSDADVETVIRKTVLSKKADKVQSIMDVIERNHGEVSRHLQTSRIAPSNEDEDDYAEDYPLLPVRRRFWEKVLRNVDESGTTSQLRTQLKIVFDAAKETAEKELGTVVPADYIYDQISSDLLNTGVLQREYYETIAELKGNGKNGVLKSRICACIFLISRLPRSPSADDGVRATPETIADLLVEDLGVDGARLREDVPKLLAELVEHGKIMSVGDEYILQTREGADWNQEYNQRRGRMMDNEVILSEKRNELLKTRLAEQMKSVSITHGSSRLPRDIAYFLTSSKPSTSSDLVLWLRDGWSEDEKTVVAEARVAGPDDPMIFGMLPRACHEEFKRHIASYLAAEQTLTRSNPTTSEAIQAKKAIEALKETADIGIQACLDQIFEQTRIYLGGGSEVDGADIREKLKKASDYALQRLYPKFSEADHNNWSMVLTRARGEHLDALTAIGYTGEIRANPICKEILKYVTPNKTGKEVRDHFQAPPFGWPRDAIDAALVLITLSGSLRATLNGQPVAIAALNQGQMGKYQFNVDVPPLSPKQRLEIKALFKQAGVDTPLNQESDSARRFIEEMKNLALSAGGEPPLPAEPDTSLLEELEGLSGNTQLNEIHSNKAELEANVKEWKNTKTAIDKRLPRWILLQKLKRYAGHIPEAADYDAPISAIRDGRNLLGPSDPVEPLIAQMLQLLRERLNELHAQLEETYSREQRKLEASEAWKKLKEEQRLIIAQKNMLLEPKKIKVATEDDILDTLEEGTLENRRTQIEAIPQRFIQAIEEAARLLEPKASRVSLPSATIKNETDLEEWVENVRRQVKDRLKEGPVIL